jgi:hypothetical protein
MLELLAPDAELEFTGIPVGPFAGREAIGEAYRVQPPDDETDEVHVEERGGAIVRIRVHYDQFSRLGAGWKAGGPPRSALRSSL